MGDPMTEQHSANPPPAGDRAPALDAAARQAWLRGEHGLDRGDYAQAERCLAEALRLAPEHPDVLRSWAIALHQLGRHGEAAAALRRVIAQRPGDGLAYNALGTALGASGDADGAVEALRRACALEPGLAAAWFNLGKALGELARAAEAAEALRRALAIDPGFEPARFLLAEALMMDGRVADSAAEYRELLRRSPRSGLAWWGLANLKTTRLDEEDAQRLAELVRRADVGPDDRLAAAFALGKALDDVGRPEQAFAAYVEANALARRRIAWNAAAFDAWLERVLAACDALPPAPAGEAFGREAIFVVGLPRSGSTLTEQILAAHPQVEGASELGDLGAVIGEESQRRRRPFPDWVGEATPEDWRRLGGRYLERTARWRERRPRFTDKAPGNWVLIGAIRAMLPGARIVDCRRDAVETCWSCFRQIFWQAHEYSYDLGDLAAYWHAHDRALRHWLGRHAGAVREQVYEDLLAEPEAQTRALLAFCGLPFDPACLRPHEAARSVRTASAAQVREPLRRDTARTSRYGALLDPLRRALAR